MRTYVTGQRLGSGGLFYVTHIVEMTSYDHFRRCGKISTITRLEWVIGFRFADAGCRTAQYKSVVAAGGANRLDAHVSCEGVKQRMKNPASSRGGLYHRMALPVGLGSTRFNICQSSILNH